MSDLVGDTSAVSPDLDVAMKEQSARRFRDGNSLRIAQVMAAARPPKCLHTGVGPSLYFDRVSTSNTNSDISTPCISCQPSPGETGFTRRSAIKVGLGLALAAGAASAFIPSAAANAAWGGYSNGHIPTSALTQIPWSPGRFLRADATSALIDLNLAFRQAFGYDLILNDAYRDYAKQVEARTFWCNRGACNYAAVPGTSNHGWALAIDINVGRTDWGSPIYIWMKVNAGRYGWIHPAWAEPGGYAPEAWHWEYTGTYTPTQPEPATPPAEETKDDDMFKLIQAPNDGHIYIVGVSGKRVRVQSVYHAELLQRFRKEDALLTAELDLIRTTYLEPIL